MSRKPIYSYPTTDQLEVAADLVNDLCREIGKLDSSNTSTSEKLFQLLSGKNYNTLIEKSINIFLKIDPARMFEKCHLHWTSMGIEVNENESVLARLLQSSNISEEKVRSFALDPKTFDDGENIIHILFRLGSESQCRTMINSLSSQELSTIMEFKDNYDITPLHHLFANQSQKVCILIIQSLCAKDLARICSIKSKTWNVTPLDILFMSENSAACAILIKKLSSQQLSSICRDKTHLEFSPGGFLMTDVGPRFQEYITKKYYFNLEQQIFRFFFNHVLTQIELRQFNFSLWRPNLSNYLAFIAKLEPQQYLANTEFLFKNTKNSFNLKNVKKYSLFLELLIVKDWAKSLQLLNTISLQLMVDNIEPLLASVKETKGDGKSKEILLNPLEAYKKHLQNLDTVILEPKEFVDFIHEVVHAQNDHSNLKYLIKIIDMALEIISPIYSMRLASLKVFIAAQLIKVDSTNKIQKDKEEKRGHKRFASAPSYREQSHQIALTIKDPISLAEDGMSALIIGESLAATYQSAYHNATKKVVQGEVPVSLSWQNIRNQALMNCHEISRQGLEFLIIASPREAAITLISTYYLDLPISKGTEKLIKRSFAQLLPQSNSSTPSAVESLDSEEDKLEEQKTDILQMHLQTLKLRSERVKALGLDWVQFSKTFSQHLKADAFFQQQLAAFKFQFEMAYGFGQTDLAVKIITDLSKELKDEINRTSTVSSQTLAPLEIVQNCLRAIKQCISTSPSVGPKTELFSKKESERRKQVQEDQSKASSSTLSLTT